MCSPTRAALLTGVNPHRAGVGHVANSDPGFPGYAAELADDVRDDGRDVPGRRLGHARRRQVAPHQGRRHVRRRATQARGRCSGGSTATTGSSRRSRTSTTPTAGRGQPHGRGRPVPRRLLPDRRPDRPGDRHDPPGQGVGPGQAVPAATSPTARCTRRCRPRPPTSQRHRGAYDAGWDVVREARHRAADRARRHRRRRRAPARATPRRATTSVRGTTSAATSAGCSRATWRSTRRWSTASTRTSGDFGRALDELGVLDDTIFVFTSDNGGSREGEARGHVGLLPHAGVEEHHGHGGHRRRPARASTSSAAPGRSCHYPRGWAMASNTPFRLYKINTHAGGHSVPFIVSWPSRTRTAAARRAASGRSSPTCCRRVLELAGVEPPASSARPSVAPAAARARASRRSCGDRRLDARPPLEQYFEMDGHRGYYRDGLGDRDPARAAHPVRRPRVGAVRPARPTEPRPRPRAGATRAGRGAGRRAGRRRRGTNQVYPLDEGSGLRYLTRPP